MILWLFQLFPPLNHDVCVAVFCLFLLNYASVSFICHKFLSAKCHALRQGNKTNSELQFSIFFARLFFIPLTRFRRGVGQASFGR